MAATQSANPSALDICHPAASWRTARSQCSSSAALARQLRLSGAQRVGELGGTVIFGRANSMPAHHAH
jgi:hypothetical protein